MSERCSSVDCARSRRESRPASCQSWIERGATGRSSRTCARSSGASGSGARSNGSTPSASRIGGRLLAAAAEVRLERRAGLERRAADDVQERQLRRRGRAADLDQLAVAAACSASAAGRCGGRASARARRRRRGSRTPRPRSPGGRRRRRTASGRGSASSRGARCGRAAGTRGSTAPARRSRPPGSHGRDGASCASARWTARSCTDALPTAVIASTAAPTAMPERDDERARRVARAGGGARSGRGRAAARAPRARGGPDRRLRLRSPPALILAGGSTGDNDLPVAPSGGARYVVGYVDNEPERLHRRDGGHSRMRNARRPRLRGRSTTSATT